MKSSERGVRVPYLPILGPIMSFGWLVLMAFMRRFCTPTGCPGVMPVCGQLVGAEPGSRGALGCSTGNTRRRFFGSLARACNRPTAVTYYGTIQSYNYVPLGTLSLSDLIALNTVLRN